MMRSLNERPKQMIFSRTLVTDIVRLWQVNAYHKLDCHMQSMQARSQDFVKEGYMGVCMHVCISMQEYAGLGACSPSAGN